jgi:DNA invertase Pin-like site-specific DNA recombinase
MAATARRSARHREGCNTLVGHGTLGQVGVLLSYDVTRLARHGSDCSPLLDLWSSQGGVMADVDGLYAPAPATGRRRLGVQGTRSAWALPTRRARMTAGLLTQAARGALALTLPTGLARDPLGRVHQDPHLAVQARIPLVCATCVPRRSASQGLAFFTAHGLRLPRRERCGAVVWTRPTSAALLAMLKHPASAGTLP